MPDTIVYRGFEVHATPCRLKSGGWSHEGYLIERRDSGTRQTRFFAGGSSPEREQAVEAILAEARRLIDFRSGEDRRSA